MGEHSEPFPVGARGRLVYLTAADKVRAEEWVRQGYHRGDAHAGIDADLRDRPTRRTRSSPTRSTAWAASRACLFSNWSQNEQGTTGKKADPRSFCIQKTLQEISHSDKIDDQLMFAGHNAYRFASDPFYANGFIPTVKQLVERLTTGY